LKDDKNIRLSKWVEGLLSKGKISFIGDQIKESFPTLSDIAIKRSLARLTAKGKVVSIYRGYYLIIPPQYMARKILPPPLFIDGLMKFLEKPYYVGLLNAAGFHGAAHQQPQEYFVFTNFPVLRPTKKKNIKINYISKKIIIEDFLEQKKTEAGFIKISNPALTAIDLVQFDKRIGGLNRSATVLNELAEAIKPEQITERLLKEAPVTAVQRLGYLLEAVLSNKEIGNHLYKQSKKAGLDFFRVPLKLSAATKGFPSDERWKVIINSEIEVDE
jgi:predicted transcriptional regulator of viral defense system